MTVSSLTRWEEFLERYCKEEIISLARSYPDVRRLNIKFKDVEKWDCDVAQEALESPDVVLTHVYLALQSPSLQGAESLDKAHIGICDLPERISISGSLIDYINKLVSVDGLVRKVSFTYPHTLEAAFRCQRCEHVTYMPQLDGRFIEPYECENETCGRKGPFKEIISLAKLIARQAIEVQEPPENLPAGQQAQGIKVILDDDLAGSCRCGDRVEIVGILRAQRRTTSSGGKSPALDLHIQAVSLIRETREFESIEISREEVEQIKELASDPDIYYKLVRSIAPAIYGYEEVKEAISYQLFGGVSRKLAGGTNLRGNIHVLLVGDPGVAKSQLLKFAAGLSPRGIYTIGTGSTAAGLTAAAVKDSFQEGRWTLEAGALVLADKGFAAVDELEKLAKEDLPALNEVLEQQTVSIAKAGINTTLNARCSCLSAANPKYGVYDRYEPMAEQIGLPPALLSRFDLIFLIMDRPDLERDEKIADHILSVRQIGLTGDIAPPISQNLMRKYIAYAQREISPVLSDEAKGVIKEFYVNMRKVAADGISPVPLTARNLEALIRLCEAIARIRLSNEVSREDAERAIRLMEASMGQVMTDPETGKLDASMITAGMSRSQRDKIKMLREIIKTLQEEHKGGAPREEIISQAEESGIKNVEEIMSKLKGAGEIIESKNGYFRVV